MQRNSHPLPWRPKGISDTLDASQSFAGAMSALQNLIPDPSTAGLWQCRPAAAQLINFSTMGGPFSSGFSSGFQVGFSQLPIGLISALKVLGNFAYGMVATGKFAGKDEPFCYNLSTNQIVAVSGVTNNNTPNSPVATGVWTPPTMALVGAKLVVTHPGFTGVGNGYFGVFDVSNPTSPAWSSGNLTGAVTFTAVPSAVAQFNGRAYYIQNVLAQPSVVFSDALVATNCTNATQILTFGDNVALTGLGPLQLDNQLGGVVQALMVFKGLQNLYQVTGDAANTPANLSINTLNITTGTLAPNTIVTTPTGLAFVSPDGVRVVDFNGRVGNPIGMDGQGITVPFINSVVPSRMAAACSGNILRVSTQNGNAAGSPNQEYWFDFARGIWSGPHTFPAALIQPYNNTFIMAPVGITGTLWQSDPVQSSTSSYTENGSQLVWNWVTPMLPDTDQMTQNSMTEGTLDMALSSSIPNINVNAIDQNMTVLNAVQIVTPTGATQWGAFQWGSAIWAGAPNALAPRQLPWTKPVNFTRLQVQATGLAAAGIKLGTMHLRYQILNYLSNLSAVA
jgi:hypothetical protein